MASKNLNGLSSLGVLGLSKKIGQEAINTPTRENHLRGSLKIKHITPKCCYSLEQNDFNRCSLKVGEHENISPERTKALWYLNKTTASILMFQALFTILFTAFVRYSSEADAGNIRNSIHPHLGGYEHENLFITIREISYTSSYLFVCLSFHLIRLRDFNFEFLGEFILINCVSLEWSILVLGLMKPSDGGKVTLSIERIVACEYSSVAVMISFLCLVGRISLLQLTTMQFLQVPLQVFATHVLDTFLQVNDGGKTMTSHTFGAFYGTAVSLALFTNKKKELKKAPRIKNYRLLTLIGLVSFLVCWPNICVSDYSGDAQRRIVVNTFIALISAAVTAFPFSSIFNPSRKFCFEAIYDAVIGTGVVISSVSLLKTEGYGAMLIGSITAALCIGIRSLYDQKLVKLIGIHDSCGVFVTHGFAGVVAGLLSAAVAAVASPDLGNHGYRLYDIYPARSPVEGSSALKEVNNYLPQLPGGKGRSATVQAAMQLLGLLIVLLIASSGGAITGLLLRLKIFKPSEGQSADNHPEGGDGHTGGRNPVEGSDSQRHLEDNSLVVKKKASVKDSLLP